MCLPAGQNYSRNSELSQHRGAFHSQNQRHFPNRRRARFYHKLQRHKHSAAELPNMAESYLESDKESGQFATVSHLKLTTTWHLPSPHDIWHPSGHLAITALPLLSRSPPTSYDSGVCLIRTAESCDAGTREPLQPQDSPIWELLTLKPFLLNLSSEMTFVKTLEGPLTWCVPWQQALL